MMDCVQISMQTVDGPFPSDRSHPVRCSGLYHFSRLLLLQECHKVCGNHAINHRVELRSATASAGVDRFESHKLWTRYEVIQLNKYWAECAQLTLGPTRLETIRDTSLCCVELWARSLTHAFLLFHAMHPPYGALESPMYASARLLPLRRS